MVKGGGSLWVRRGVSTGQCGASIIFFGGYQYIRELNESSDCYK